MKIIAGLPGLTTGYGGTHQAIEDLALMRMIPGLTIIDPCDATEIDAATAAIADHPGAGLHAAPARHRAGRARSASYRSRSARRDACATASDVGIISTGLMTERALDAAAALASAGHRRGRAACADDQAVRRRRGRRRSPPSVDQVVTAENHVVVGGLASLVVEALFDAGIMKPVTRIGLPDRYIECGVGADSAGALRSYDRTR